MEVGGRRRRWQQRWWRRSDEVAEYVGVGKNNYEEPGPRGGAGDFYLRGNGGRSTGKGGCGGGGIDALLEINDSNKCRTLLLRTTKTLAAYQLGKERSLKQLHTDETGRRQKQLV